WTPEEDARLLELVSKFGSNWVEISRQIGTRNRSQCLLRWRQTLKPGVSRGRWTKSEDEKLVEAVNIHGLNSWTKVSGHVETRNDAQCRERYLNTLNPDLKRGDFSKQENDLLLELVAKHGPKWAKVATDMRTRTAKMCKRQYEAISSFGDEVDEDVVDEDEVEM
ncbi:Homeodomain-like protein, partial [Obelidium mucronatum]